MMMSPATVNSTSGSLAKAVRLETLDAICKALDCQPGDILEYVDSQEEEYGNKQQ